MGKQPLLMAQSVARVGVVACHPRQPVVAAGYADGAVILVRIDDGALLHGKAARAGRGERARLGRQRADCRLWHRRRRGRCAKFMIAAALRPVGSGAVQFRRVRFAQVMSTLLRLFR